MKLRVERLWFTAQSTIGQLWVEGLLQCYTLEPRKDQSEGKPYCIPEGTYSGILQYSPRFQIVTPHLLGVPGFDEIEIHPGNVPGDTEGCTLVGKVYQPSTPDFIGQSRLAFAELMDKLDTAFEISYAG